MNANRYLRLGCMVARGIPARRTLDEVASKLGITKQLAWYLVHHALGKLVYRARKAVREKS